MTLGHATRTGSSGWASAVRGVEYGECLQDAGRSGFRRRSPSAFLVPMVEVGLLETTDDAGSSTTRADRR